VDSVRVAVLSAMAVADEAKPRNDNAGLGHALRYALACLTILDRALKQSSITYPSRDVMATLYARLTFQISLQEFTEQGYRALVSIVKKAVLKRFDSRVSLALVALLALPTGVV